MHPTTRILVSNIALPTKTIGSWTTRLSQFIERNPSCFDIILSPEHKGNANIYCKKRKFFTWKKRLRHIQLLKWVAADYIKHIKKLSTVNKHLTIIVMDDPHLLEAITLIKQQLTCTIDLIFSFHGFKLQLRPDILNATDKILFLSHTGLGTSKAAYNSFPNSVVVGNAVDSKVFYPLKITEFIEQRHRLGYTVSDEILIWLANDRPKKGFDIFKKVSLTLLEEYKNLKVLIIGSRQTINHTNVKSIGRIANSDVAKYLQIGNYYMFTTRYNEGFGLSMIEALKCGNMVIASHRGAIAEVLGDLPNTYLVDTIDDKNAWVETFKRAKSNAALAESRITREESEAMYNYKTWETKFLNAIS